MLTDSHGVLPLFGFTSAGSASEHSIDKAACRRGAFGNAASLEEAPEHVQTAARWPVLVEWTDISRGGVTLYLIIV